MSTTRLPELPTPSPKDCFPYKVELYVDGYPEQYVQEYARAYGLAVWKAAMEAAAAHLEWMGGVHYNGWHDAASAIRALPLPEQGGPQERHE